MEIQVRQVTSAWFKKVKSVVKIKPKGECGSQSHVEIQVAVPQADVMPGGAGPILGDQHTWLVFDTVVSARGTGPKLLELKEKKWKVG